MLCAFFDQLIDTAAKYDIVDENPTMSKRTVEHVLKNTRESLVRIEVLIHQRAAW